MDTKPVISRPTGTVSFLFTDIESSTRHWEEHRAWMERAFKRQEAIIREAAASHGGYVYKMVGDAFQIAFSDAASAVAAAAEAQRALHAEPWGDWGPIRVRMALHTGISEERGDDYVGPALNRLARLLSAGHGGQVLLTQAACELAQDNLPQGATLRDLGEHRLKDLSRPEHIHQVIAPDLPSDFPPLKTFERIPNNLPVPMTRFVGRAHEKTEIKCLVRTNRLLTLTGPGGTGKTRLALEAATELVDDLSTSGPCFADGVFFVALAPISDPALILPTVAQILGVCEVQGTSQQEQLKDYLQAKNMLLLLDNFEQILPASQWVSELLTDAPHLHLLVTSRSPLGIYGEINYTVLPLSLPDPKQKLSLEQLAQSESVTLFVERGRAVKPGFALSAENAQAVAEICTRLDGLPLAVELATARLRLLPPHKILAQLEHRLSFLSSGAHDLPARQQTLRGAIDWSYILLDEGEMRLFRQMAVFVHGCTLEAAEALCADCGDPPVGVLDAMAALVDKSLLYQKEGEDGEPRFMMLDTVREYAQEQLQASGEAFALQDHHCAYYADFMHRREASLAGRNQRGALSEIEGEIENIRAGWDWAVEHIKIPELAACLESLSEFYRMRGWYQEGERAFARAAQRLEGIESGSEPREFRMLQGKVLLQEGRFLDFIGQVEQAREHWNAALALFRNLDARRETAFALCCLGGCDGIYGGAADSPEIRGNCLDGLALFTEISDQRGIAFALRGLGWAALHGGDYALAKQRFQASVDAYRQVEDQEGLISSLGALGYTVWILGEYREAKQIHEGMLVLCQETGDQGGIARALGDLGIDACGLREFRESQQLFQQSLEHYREIGYPWGIADELGDLGEIALAMGEYETAAQRARESLAVKGRITRRFHSWELRILGIALCKLGNFQEARKYLHEAIEVGAALGQPSRLLYALVGVATLFEAEGDKERALDLLAFVLCHRATWQHIRDRAAPLVTRLEAELPPEVIAAAEARGRRRNLEETVNELLVELRQSQS